uniref:NAD-dependent epimerase/dehydratase n=1 Tax=Caulobacter sp. (strain K31) TaxID=366602 RepID=B0T6M7_CAUSK
MPKTVLVLGATGGVGRPIAGRLAERGWTVRALHRNPSLLATSDPFDWIQGDALNPTDVAKAAKGVSTIVHAVKPRAYRDWKDAVLPMIDNTIAAARGARIVLPGNVYNYGPDAGLILDEDAPQNPRTKKGRLRVEMEARISRAVDAGSARALIVRAGDFFGPGAGSSWFSEAMVKPGGRPRVVRNPATLGVGHQWVFLPDLAETFARLIDRDDLPNLARYNMDGHWDADGREMAAAIVRALGEPAVPVKPLPWGLLTLVAPFSPNLRELVELRSLWDTPIRLSNRRLVEVLGEEPHTPLDEAVRQTLAFLQSVPES